MRQWRRVTSWRPTRQVACSLWSGLSGRSGVNCCMPMGTVHQWDTCVLSTLSPACIKAAEQLASALSPLWLPGCSCSLSSLPRGYEARHSASLLHLFRALVSRHTPRTLYSVLWTPLLDFPTLRRSHIFPWHSWSARAGWGRDLGSICWTL